MRSLLGLTTIVAVTLALLTLAVRYPQFGSILGFLAFAVGGVGGELLSGRFRCGVIMAVATYAMFYVVASNLSVTVRP